MRSGTKRAGRPNTEQLTAARAGRLARWQGPAAGRVRRDTYAVGASSHRGGWIRSPSVLVAAVSGSASRKSRLRTFPAGFRGMASTNLTARRCL